MDSIVLDDSNPKDTQPKEIKIPLKTHQLTLLKKSRELENSSHNSIKLYDSSNNTESELKSTFGIIGDIVGSGKTLTILAIIAKKNLLQNKLPKMMNKGTITCTEISLDEYDVKPYNIIVVPHTIYKQWVSTIENYTTLKYFGINNKKSFEAFSEIFKSDETSKAFDAKIILVANTRFADFNRLNLPYWNQYSHYSRYIFDEADMMKIGGSQFIKYSFMWFVTSSYKTLLNPYVRIVWKNSNGETSDYYNYNEGFNIRSRQGGLTHSGFIKNYM